MASQRPGPFGGQCPVFLGDQQKRHERQGLLFECYGNLVTQQRGFSKNWEIHIDVNYLRMIIKLYPLITKLVQQDVLLKQPTCFFAHAQVG